MNINLKSKLSIFMLYYFISSCGIFSFLGGLLSPSVRTFSIQADSNSVDGPPDLYKKISNGLEERIIRMYTLSHQKQDGDIQYQLTIKSFKYTPAFSAISDESKDVERLTVTIEVSYYNRFDEESSFKDKYFSASQDLTDVDQKETKEPDLIQGIIRQLIDDILKKSIDIW